MKVPVIDLGVMPYVPALEIQRSHVEQVLAARESGRPEPGRLLIVEHPPVITITRRAGASAHLLASADELRQRGIEVCETDRGGDITYHGPGQRVIYPVLDLNLLNLGLHAYMRMLEDAVIDACGALGIAAHKDPKATGVWVQQEGAHAKICAMGVRVRKWVSMHGLALNVTTDLSHFGFIVPCGISDRAVTSVEQIYTRRGETCPPPSRVTDLLTMQLSSRITRAAEAAREARVTCNPPRNDSESK